MHLIVTPLPSPRHFVTSFRLSRASPSFFFFFNDTATTEIYTLSLHDALPISNVRGALTRSARTRSQRVAAQRSSRRDRKSTRLNSSHLVISYAVFCLKKKKKSRSDGSEGMRLRTLLLRRASLDANPDRRVRTR